MVRCANPTDYNRTLRPCLLRNKISCLAQIQTQAKSPAVLVKA
jgi:hypothetical protein